MRPVSNISGPSLQAFHQSELFGRLSEVYRGYPAHSLQSDAARAILHHLVVSTGCKLALEIGSYHCGTTEVLARALHEVGGVRLDTIDPYGATRCPPIIAEWPEELRSLVRFQAVNSGSYFEQAFSSTDAFDFILIDGNHEYEFALFDLWSAARIVRPNGIIVLDNIEQPGPKFATRDFMRQNPGWVDVAGVLGQIDRVGPLDLPPPSFPGTMFYIIQAPPHYMVGPTPRSFGVFATPSANVDGIHLDIAQGQTGTLHIQVFGRTFGVVIPEQILASHRIQLNGHVGPLKVALPSPIRSALQGDLPRRVEVILAFEGALPMALSAPPTPYFG